MQLGVVIVAGMLVVGAFYDLWKREVPDKVWLLFGGLGGFLTVVDVYFGRIGLLTPSLLVGITVVLAISLYYFGFYGGADAKALIAISIILPVYEPANFVHPFAALMILANTVTLSLFLPVALAAFNVMQMLNGKRIFEGLESEPSWRKAAACFIGYRAAPGRVKRFQLKLENVENGVRKLRFSLLRNEEEFAEEGDRWVTPGIPLVVFMLAGVAVLVLFGDLTTVVFKMLLPFY